MITLLTALSRYMGLSSMTADGYPIFDETHYAPQAWQMLGNHELEDNPGLHFVVHPLVGKYVMVMAQVCDGFSRRNHGVMRPWRAVMVRDFFPNIWGLLGILCLIYVASYIPWFASETGSVRHTEGWRIHSILPGQYQMMLIEEIDTQPAHTALIAPMHQNNHIIILRLSAPQNCLKLHHLKMG